MAMKYVGGGYIVGVPARDLTDEEEDKFGTMITEQQEITGLKLYTAISNRVKKAQEHEEAK